MSDIIKAIQTKLVALGHKEVAIDGVPGPKTYNATNLELAKHLPHTSKPVPQVEEKEPAVTIPVVTTKPSGSYNGPEMTHADILDIFKNRGQKLDIIPFAEQAPAGSRMTTKGKYPKGYPVGLIVHFTAGRDGALKTILGGIKNGYTYLCTQKDGKCVQAHPVSRWGWHAGKSLWQRLVGTVSDDLIGMEINNAGRLTSKGGKLMSWFGTEIAEKDARYSKKHDNIQEGWYEAYTRAQEHTLVKTIFWLKAQAPETFSFDFVLGHDEVAPKRKNDPGAALWCTMPEFRDWLKKEYARLEMLA